ncbi:hypothetical protein GCM10011512_16750 [Tersicoccus solisilvae]|uniref:CAAX prenyl protease 2/Lysostaphin resistance protein A-like domain-containing protein n=1 Tax=Tersicoccus solisilvae TaxID=1882339 RepID=A0ABQ1P3X1_9MICC|nr:CPBP family intramembrane glutamic endopeptidase [Tersicoccus solisilvae]GGC90445.1 hypothetical protein GCM10011512_16750 [Tersicoccus solisilvae]
MSQMIERADGRRSPEHRRPRTVMAGLLAVALALVPVLCTAVASAAAQILGLDEASAALVIGAGAAVSAAIGVVVLAVAPFGLTPVRFGVPRRVRAVWWFLPLLLTVVIAVATQGIHVRAGVLAAYAVLVLMVAVNEEVWFRGIILAVLRPSGVRVAVIGSSLVFGVLHLANLAGGAGAAESVLQVVFAVLFGVVAAELTLVTGSLWPAVVWHAAWDFANFLGGNATTATALTGIALACAVMLAYAVLLWRRASRARR